jgi:hypothetical protein
LETKPKHVFKPTRGSYFYICLLGGIGLVIGACLFISHAFEKTYPQLLDISGAILMLVAGIFCVFYCFNRKVIYVYENSLLIKSPLLQRTTKINNTEIQSWAEVEKKSKSSSWQELLIFTALGKHRFESYNYDDYYSLRSEFTKNFKRNVDYEKDSNTKTALYFGLGLSAIGFVLLSIGVYNLVEKDTPIAADQFVAINQIVTSGIEIKKSGKSSRRISLKLNDYPEFDFNIKGSAYTATYADDFVKNVTIGDTLALLISKEDFEEKIAKTKPLTFWDKSVKYYDISVYGVAHKETRYLTLADYKLEKESLKKSNWITSTIIGTIILGLGLFLFIKRNNTAAS